jgi:serine/threonine-protein kinase ULK4
MRQSVDVMRLSRIALSNLEKEGDGSDYAAAEVSASLPQADVDMGCALPNLYIHTLCLQVQPGDIRIENADAELDFDEQKEECKKQVWAVLYGCLCGS